MKRFFWAALAATAFVIALTPPAAAHASSDLWADWEQAHGIGVVKTSGGHDVIWSSEYVQGSTAEGDWTHDVYGRTVRGSQASADKTLVTAREAQEPASCARTKDGHILVTFEDGNAPGDFGVMQRYAIFDDDLNPVVAYDADSTIIRKGGHSGHVAAMGNKFVTAVDDGWVDKDGFKNNGTGEDVYLNIMNSTGGSKKIIKVMDTKARFDWPVVAASSRNALLVWQKIVPGKNYTYLMTASYKAGASKTSKPKLISGFKCKYYNYSVCYVPGAKRYLVTATDTKGKGHALLFTEKGKLVWQKAGLPAFKLEAPAAVSGSKVVIPTGKKNLTMFKVSKKSVKKVATKKTSLTWNNRGQAGLFTAKNKVTFYSLGATGVKQATVSFGSKGAKRDARQRVDSSSRRALTAASSTK